MLGPQKVGFIYIHLLVFPFVYQFHFRIQVVDCSYVRMVFTILVLIRINFFNHFLLSLAFLTFIVSPLQCVWGCVFGCVRGCTGHTMHFMDTSCLAILLVYNIVINNIVNFDSLWSSKNLWVRNKPSAQYANPQFAKMSFFLFSRHVQLCLQCFKSSQHSKYSVSHMSTHPQLLAGNHDNHSPIHVTP